MSSYVKLTKDQAAPLEDIKAGELNQPIRVPQLRRKICLECGQQLPEAHVPPSDEPWMTGICGCAEDPESCKTGLFCPCVLYGQNMETIHGIPWQESCLCHATFLCVGAGLAISLAICNGTVSPDAFELMTEGLICGWNVFSMYTSTGRDNLQKKFHLKNSPCDSCLVHAFMHPCAICQEHREMKRLIIDDTVNEDTVIDPPSVQEMSISIVAIEPGNSST
ncbi:cell number regulator 6-like [Carex rostrata]